MSRQSVASGQARSSCLCITNTYKALLLCLFSAVLTTIVFGRVLFFDFVNLDDNSNLKKNPAMHNLALAWEKPYLDAYLPVVYTVWNGLYQMAKTDRNQGSSIETWSPIPELDPLPFHAANLLLHTLNGVLLFVILHTIFTTASRVLLASLAVLFAVHPLQVEAVAWVTALKDVLSGTLSLLLILLYVRKPLSRTITRNNTQQDIFYTLLLSLVFFLACLSKSTRLFLPLWLVWLGHLHWKKPFARTLAELWPLLAIAALVMLIAMAVQPLPKDMAYQDIWQRPLVAADALTFYIFKLLWPAQLAVDYGRNPRFLFESGQVYWTTIVTCLFIVSLWYWRNRIHPWLLLGLGGFVLSLLPVLGLKPFVFQTISTVSDRYCYLSIALLLIGCVPVLSRVSTSKTLLFCAVLLCTLLATRSWLQVPVWTSSATLWQHTLSVTPESGIAHNNLASIHEELGNIPEAIRHYEQSTQRLPLAQTFARIAILYTDMHNWTQAREWNEKGLILDPTNSLMLNNRQFIQSHLQRRHFAIPHPTPRETPP